MKRKTLFLISISALAIVLIISAVSAEQPCLSEGQIGICHQDKCCAGLKEECMQTGSVGSVPRVICTKCQGNNCSVDKVVDESDNKSGIAIVGNDRDAHGCIPSAGYQWCEAKQKCLRIWEENCSSLDTKCENDSDCPGSTSCKNKICIANDCSSDKDCIGGWYCNSGKCAIVNGVTEIIVNNTNCEKDSDCRINICGQNSCVNISYQTPNGVGCAFPPSMRADYCKCENNICKGYKASGGPPYGKCGDGVCDYLENIPSLENQQPNPYYCPQDCNNSKITLPGEGKTKILPETASLRARERLGELGFNISLKDVGQNKTVYFAEAEKQGRFLGLFKIKANVSVEIDSETGEVIKVHKPWWGFLAGI